MTWRQFVNSTSNVNNRFSITNEKIVDSINYPFYLISNTATVNIDDLIDTDNEGKY